MLKKCVVLFSILASNISFSATAVDLYLAPESSLSKFQIEKQSKKLHRGMVDRVIEENTLALVNLTKKENKNILRYQQMYQGVPVVGAQVMISKNSGQGISATASDQVNGRLFEEIDIKTTPAFNAEKAINLAKKSYFNTNQKVPIQDEQAVLQIRSGQDNDLKLVYLVSFKTVQKEKIPAWPFFIIDAQTGEITKQWNNIKTYSDSGPGGNEKVHEYWYGKDGLPGLEVTQVGSTCIMDTPHVALVKVGSSWDFDNNILTPFQYQCNNNVEENVNGAFSPANDAFYFGHLIVGMYQDWYGVNALQNANGTPMKLIMRVHFGTCYDNAFWDGKVMSFGDGDDFYPLVSLDVAGHEVTHGFTEQHSGLEYHDQSGALNESLSDMAGQASRAYLLEKNSLMYSKAYLDPSQVTWGIGETITREAFGKALRFMDYPSSDGSSADCLDKSLAQSSGAYCAISYGELVAFAHSEIADPEDRQNFIVHTASGVFNKAFYLMAKDFGIKDAYHIMLQANTKYWTPTTGFKDGACGVLRAAKDLNKETQKVQLVFNQVGVDTKSCVF